MSRALKVLALAAALLLALVVTLAYTLPQVIEAVGTRYLKSQGITPASFRVAEVSLNRVVITDIAIGNGLRMARAEATIDLGARIIDTLTLHGPVLSARWEDGILQIPGLPPLTAEGGGGAPPPLPVKHLIVDNGHAIVAAGGGRAEATLDASLTIDPAHPWAVSGRARARLSMADVTLPEIAENLSLDARLSLDGDAASYTLSLAGPATFAATRLLHPASPVDGPVAGTLSGPGEHPFTLTVHPPKAGNRWAEAAIAAAAEAHAADQQVSMIAEGRAFLDSGGTLRDSAFARLEVAGRGIATPVGTADLSLRLTDLRGIPLNARAAYALDATLHELRSGDIAAPQSRLQAGGTVRWSGFAALLDIDAASVRVTGPATAGALSLPRGLAWDLEPLGDLPALEVAVGAEGGLTVIPRLALVTPKVHAHTPATHLDIAFQRGELEGVITLPDTGTAQLSARLDGGTIAADGLIFRNVDGTLVRENGRTVLDLATTLRHLPGEPEHLSTAALTRRPLYIAGHAESTGDAPWVFRVITNDATGRRLITARGKHDLAKTEGWARLWTPTLTFTPDGLQPRDIHASLAGTGAVFEGEAAARGTLGWTATRFTQDVEIMLRDMTITRSFLRLQQLNTVIRLNKLWPPRTPPGQRASLAALDAGVRFSDVLATFRLDGRGTLEIDGASLHLAEGTITAPPTRIPLDLRTAATILYVKDVRLGPLVETAGIEGLVAEGMLSGTLPVRLNDGIVSFHDGRLKTSTPGVVRYTPETPPAQLAAAGQSAALVLQALENFHYESLELRLDGQVGGDFEVSFHAQGANPDLYEGYPIKLNLRVSGALTEIIGRGLTGYRVPAQIRDRLRKFESMR